MAEIKELRGNIFDTSCDVIVNTVNCVGVMGRGIALEIKHRFPDVYEAYRIQCEKKQMLIGKLFLYRGSKPWILNFPTKFHWKYPSKLRFIEAGLDDFVRNYKSWGIKSVAFPRLGTEAGKLNWEEVRQMMYKKLSTLADLYVEIYQFAPLTINFRDEMFDKLIEIAKKFSIEDYVSQIGLTKRQAIILKNVVSGDITSVHSMRELGKVKGLGKKSIERIYEFVRSSPFNQMACREQLELFGDNN